MKVPAFAPGRQRLVRPRFRGFASSNGQPKRHAPAGTTAGGRDEAEPRPAVRPAYARRRPKDQRRPVVPCGHRRGEETAKVPAPRKHDDATMARAVAMYHERVRGLGESKLAGRRHVGALLGINPATLRKWVEREEATSGDTDGGSGREAAEIATLRREVAELRRANDALRRAATPQAHSMPALAARPSARTSRSAADAPAGVEFVQSLERGLAVIRAFDAHNPELSLSDVARSTGLSRAVARRFLHTLVALGYVHSDGRRFALRARVLELGYAYVSSLGLPQIAQPH